jgi:hypothetical protein
MLLMALSFLVVPLGFALWLFAHRTGRTILARTLLLIGGGWAALYLGLLLLTSLTSTEADVDGLKLHFTTGHAIDHIVETFLIGDDDSLFHRKTLLKV